MAKSVYSNFNRLLLKKLTRSKDLLSFIDAGTPIHVKMLLSTVTLFLAAELLQNVFISLSHCHCVMKPTNC